MCLVVLIVVVVVALRLCVVVVEVVARCVDVLWRVVMWFVWVRGVVEGRWRKR